MFATGRTVPAKQLVSYRSSTKELVLPDFVPHKIYTCATRANNNAKTNFLILRRWNIRVARRTLLASFTKRSLRMVVMLLLPLLKVVLVGTRRIRAPWYDVYHS
jgi:hypothetical protein